MAVRPVIYHAVCRIHMFYCDYKDDNPLTDLVYSTHDLGEAVEVKDRLIGRAMDEILGSDRLLPFAHCRFCWRHNHDSHVGRAGCRYDAKKLMKELRDRYVIVDYDPAKFNADPEIARRLRRQHPPLHHQHVYATGYLNADLDGDGGAGGMDQMAGNWLREARAGRRVNR